MISARLAGSVVRAWSASTAAYLLRPVGLGPPVPRMRGHRIKRRVVTAAARVRDWPVAPWREALDLGHGFTPNRTRGCCPCGGDRAAAYGSRCGPAGGSDRPKHQMVPAARVRRQDTSVAPGIPRTAPSRSRRRPVSRRTTDRDRGPDTAGLTGRAERSGQPTPRPVIGPSWVAAPQVRAGRPGECTADERSNRQPGLRQVGGQPVARGAGQPAPSDQALVTQSSVLISHDTVGGPGTPPAPIGSRY